MQPARKTVTIDMTTTARSLKTIMKTDHGWEQSFGNSQHVALKKTKPGRPKTRLRRDFLRP